jgi:hypothetical protein
METIKINFEPLNPGEWWLGATYSFEPLNPGEWYFEKVKKATKDIKKQ